MLCMILVVAIIYRSQCCLVPEPREAVGGYSHLHSHLPAWAETVVECGKSIWFAISTCIKNAVPPNGQQLGGSLGR